jgi:hypothetical protein
MWRSGRRVDVARSWALAREQFAALVAERDHLKQELAETKQALRELQAAVLARSQAHYEITCLHRERAIARARAAERDPALPLN